MTYIRTIPADEAAGEVAGIYDIDREVFGYLPNLTQAFSQRPAVYLAWRQLNGAIKATMPLRRYELATLAAARRLRSSYCCLAHGKVLAENFVDATTLQAIMGDPGAAGLDEAEVAVMELAEKVAADATAVREADVERLRALGLDDGEIFEVVAAAAARCFFSKALDGLGVAPDAGFAQLEPELRDALTVGRPIQR